MGITQKMLTFVAKVAFPAIMDGFTPKLRQNCHCIYGSFSTLGMDEVVG
jgi:hypothetical protein